MKGAALIALALGVTACGSPSEAPPPEVKEVEVEVERVVEREVEVYRTPQACLDAINLAGKIARNAEEHAKISGDAVVAAYNRDDAAIEQATIEMRTLADMAELTASHFEAAAAECEATS